jgi:sulfite exporter TauE/SafE
MSSVEPMLVSALLLGFFGSVHCLGMCGGIAAALGQALPDQSAGSRLRNASVYSFGRITSYVAAGAIVGFFGEAFTSWTGLTVLLRVLAGLLILAFGLHVAGWWNGLAAIERIGLVVWRRLAPLGRRIGPPDRIWKIFALGMLWGWLPCGLVYAALIGAAATGQAALGAGFMACFGLGTLPALLAASGFGAQLGAFLALRSARRAAGILLLVFGFWSIAGALMPLRGHDMHSVGDMTHEAHENH